MAKKYPPILIELDKAGAEWVVVAYLTGDARMIDVVESGKSPHVATAHYMTGLPDEIILKENKLVGHNTDPDLISDLRNSDPTLDLSSSRFIPRTTSIRQAAKKANHGLNYGEQYRTFALLNEMPEADAKTIVALYNDEVYPGIPLWHQAIRDELKQNDRILSNLFGYKCPFYDKWGGDLFRAAYSYKPQSTVGYLVLHGMVRAFKDTSETFKKAQLLANVHDSLVYQFLDYELSDIVFFIEKMSNVHMNQEFYTNGRSFQIKTDYTVGLNWGKHSEDNPQGMTEFRSDLPLYDQLETYLEKSI